MHSCVRALADGASEIIGVAPGDDTAAMIDCLRRLGCGIGLRIDDVHHVADVIGTGGRPDTRPAAGSRPASPERRHDS